MTAEPDILCERVRSMFQQTPVAVGVTVANAALMVTVLVGVEGNRRAYAWLAAVVAVAALRLSLWSAYTAATPAPGRVRKWAIAGVTSAGVAGLLWGGGAVLLSAQSQTYQLLWIFLIGGMCAGAAALHYAYLPAAIAFMLPAGLPVAAQYALAGAERQVVAAAMITVFLAALCVNAWRSSRYFGDTLRLRLDLARRAIELDAANSKLQAEMAEHRATEASLHHAQKLEAVGRLTGGIAHDFNNLLTVVLGSLSLLRKRLPADDPRVGRLLDSAVQGAERGAALTQRLLAFGRRQTLKPDIVELAAMVRGMAGLLRGAFGPGVQVELHFPETIATVCVDVSQLELALLNLAANARDAMPQGGRVIISAREEGLIAEDADALPPGAYVVLGVADTGEGMDEATLAHAVEPFFTTKGIGKGTGLGLSMVHGLAAQSGGRLLLRSRKGEGTLAELWLPRTERLPARSLPEPEPSRMNMAHRRIVLLVDDDPLVRASIAAMLEDLGHTAIEANSGRDALDVLSHSDTVDLVITDYAMPGMTGLQLADELGRLKPGLPVLLASGYTELPGSTAGLPRLSKPFGQQVLAQAIQRGVASGTVHLGGWCDHPPGSGRS